MSGINTPFAPFPIDLAVLGKVVGSELNPSSSYPPDCYAQGLLKSDGTLDPSVPSQVVKFEGLHSPQLNVFALHGKISRVGVMSSKGHPAFALSATFKEGRVSNAVFGTIEPVTTTDKNIHALAGIHATFGMFPEAHWRCTEVVIGHTYWSPRIMGGRTATVENPTFFRHDFKSNETFVQFMATANDSFRGLSGRFGSINDAIAFVPPLHRLTITPDRGTIIMNVHGSVITPSSEEVKQAAKMFTECHALLQSKIGVIKWLEDHHAEPAREVNAMFNWMNGFRSAIVPSPSIFGPALPGMTGALWKKYMHVDSADGLSAHAAASNRVIQPCECTPTRKNPECNNRVCPFKHSGLILAQLMNKKPVSDRIAAIFNTWHKKTNSRGLKALNKSRKDDERIERRSAAAASAAAASLASPPVSEPKPASASASAPVSSASVKSTVTKPDSKNKGGSRTRKRRHRGLGKH